MALKCNLMQNVKGIVVSNTEVFDTRLYVLALQLADMIHWYTISMKQYF